MAVSLQETVEEVGAAVEAGFDTVLCGEHFFSSPFSSFNQMVLLTHLASEFPGLRVGTGVCLLPLHHPAEVADQLATLDVISGGRAILGAGIGYRELERAAFNVKDAPLGKVFEERLKAILALWSGEEVTADGLGFHLDGVRPNLLPLQRPHPPIWIAANNDRSVRRAARLGDGWLMNFLHTLPALSELGKTYDEELERAGRQPEERLLLREMFVASSDDAAWEAAGSSLWEKYSTYETWGQGPTMPVGQTIAGTRLSPRDDRFLVGSPSTVLSGIERCVERLGVTWLGVRVRWPSSSHRSAMDCLARLGDEVVPLLAGL